MFLKISKIAIKNLCVIKNFKVGYSTVLSKETLDNMEEFAKLLVELDNTKYLRYSTCNPMFNDDGKVVKDYVPLQQYLISTFTKKYDMVNKILGGKLAVEQDLPTCVWPREFIDGLKEKNQISFGCHLQNRNGLIFNKDGKVLPCNSLPSFPIGQYGVDFTTEDEFEKFWMSKEIVNLYNKFYEYPAKKCQKCNTYLECGGGCPLKWFAYNAKEVLGD